ncbi:nucleotidyltransferase domain-containing protein [Embleya scabrispora]|uniref:nucleotidyltransferase domain-containing protein n=1 Tax=Embleya scabrispora TaxID=159449 RepID=UPI0003803E78|nr:nucleotidyltransferase domain-containing protein [Embleya scabrispora]MYS82993.1 nucleotidyltransferase [Streptomyces sp. SID5474]
MRTLLMGLVGSTAYGLATAESDEDLLGVYIADSRQVLGLDGAKVTSGSRVTTKPDVTMHELGKYCGLALKCNPTITELLWLPEYRVETEAGRRIRALRDAFLSTEYVRAAYGGYAVQQAKRLSGRHQAGKEGFSADTAKRTAKHGRHCLRLLLQAQQLLRTGELLLDVSAHREDLFAVGRLAVEDPEAFTLRFEREKAALDAIDSVLPGHPDREAVDDLVVDLRMAALAG